MDRNADIYDEIFRVININDTNINYLEIISNIKNIFGATLTHFFDCLEIVILSNNFIDNNLYTFINSICKVFEETVDIKISSEYFLKLYQEYPIYTQYLVIHNALLICN